jgi:hypothetical protein
MIRAGNVENARCEVARRDVLAYFGELKSALTKIRTPTQFLNLDETGFSGHPEKGRKRKIVYRCDFPVKQAVREQMDPNHTGNNHFFW